jgi:hypothetical protein|nr:MAG TPA: hypothetical protein [Caudoviricetes sp.]
MSKKAYRPCPRPSGCVWDTYARTGEHLCMLAVCPYALCTARLTECREAYLREVEKKERSDLEVGHEL